MKSTLVLATRPQRAPHSCGLLTYIVEVPLYIWVELLTHKRLARNASSSRAQKPKRHAEMGWHTPPTFYEQGEFMQAGEPFPDELQDELHIWWDAFHEAQYQAIADKLAELEGRGYTWAKEQVNRLYPTTKMVRGMLTGTESAWRSVFALRASREADTAMQLLMRQMTQQWGAVDFQFSDEHIPFGGFLDCGDDAFYEVRATQAAARAARISNGKPGPGQRSDSELAADLLRGRHLSPFEHQARWVDFPLRSALYSLPNDGLRVPGIEYGWQNRRAELEEEWWK